jgi:hypothetical protein
LINDPAKALSGVLNMLLMEEQTIFSSLCRNCLWGILEDQNRFYFRGIFCLMLLINAGCVESKMAD